MLYLHNTGGIFEHQGFGRHGSNCSVIILDLSTFSCNFTSFSKQYLLASFFNWVTNRLTFGGFDFNKRSNWKSFLGALLPGYFINNIVLNISRYSNLSKKMYKVLISYYIIYYVTYIGF